MGGGSLSRENAPAFAHGVCETSLTKMPMIIQKYLNFARIVGQGWKEAWNEAAGDTGAGCAG